jgi:hypothetical protein
MADAAWTDRARPGHASLAGLTRWTLALAVFCGGFVFMEPAPYEFAFALLCCAVLAKGLRMPAMLALPVTFLAFWVCGGILAIAANGSGTKAAVYMAISAYLALSTVVFAALSAESPERTGATVRSAWLAAALITAIAGIVGYFDLLPGAGQFALYGRARGAFKDPNVFGPFLVLPALLLFQDVLSASQKRMVLSGALLGVVLIAILLSFSRAAWGHLLLSATLMAGLMFLTSRTNRLRIRIIGAGLLGVCLAGALIAALLTIPAVHDIFQARLSLMQDYDAGTFGRFGTQIRSLPDLLDSPFGFGAHGFSERFAQDPHNVYLNGFATYGWLGGFSYLLFVLATVSIGFRGLLIRTRWQGFQIAVYAAFVGVALEGAVIDTDHWRHYFLLAGLVWGLSVAALQHRGHYLRARM